jgi:hypothetical protein
MPCPETVRHGAHRIPASEPNFLVASRIPPVHETCHGDGPVSQFDLGHNSNNRDTRFGRVPEALPEKGKPT